MFDHQKGHEKRFYREFTSNDRRIFQFKGKLTKLESK